MATKLKKTNTLGTPLRLKIPAETIQLHKDHYTDGDYSAISVELFGDNESRQLVKVAIENGEGKEKIVKGIVKYYSRKELAVKRLA